VSLLRRPTDNPAVARGASDEKDGRLRERGLRGQPAGYRRDEEGGARQLEYSSGMSYTVQEKADRCVQRIYGRRGLITWQCPRKRGHGPDGRFCKMHSPEGVKARDKAREARFDAKFGRHGS